MSYVEELARTMLFVYYGLCVFGIYIFIKEEVVWRIKDRYDRIKNPVKYDRNIRKFKKWMTQGPQFQGIYISNNVDSCRIIGNVCYDINVLTVPPEYLEV